jgi:hypothetical protein
MSLVLRGNLGTSVVVAPDPASQTSAFSRALVPFAPGAAAQMTLVNVNVDSEPSDRSGPEYSSVISVTLGNPPLILDPSSPAANWAHFNTGLADIVAARASAKIEWGSGGSVNDCEVDFAQGFSFSLPASWMRVTGRNDRLPALYGTHWSLFGRAVQLSAVAGVGSLSKSNTFNAKRTVFIDSFLAANPDVFIPKFATNFMVYYDPGGFGINPLDVAVLTENGQGIMRASFPANGQLVVPVELPSDAAYLEILPSGPFDGAVIRIIFGIAI